MMAKLIRRTSLMCAVAVASVALAACTSGDSTRLPAAATSAQTSPGYSQSAPPNASPPGSIAGTWTTSDGERITFSDDGPCENAFYSNGKPLDIGGSMSCHLSNKPDSSGRYQLIVRQGGNRMTYLVEFSGDDSASVYTKNGELIYTMTRF
jgi:hypothetical protein